MRIWNKDTTTHGAKTHSVNSSDADIPRLLPELIQWGKYFTPC